MTTTLRRIVVGCSWLALAIGCAPHGESAQATLTSADVARSRGTDSDDTTAQAPSIVNDASSPEHDVDPREPLPTTCAGQTVKGAKACLPPPSFAKRLCSGIYAEVALGMFAKGTPWTRVWLAANVEAWNASGGRTARAQLAFDEEVIVLSQHSAASAGGIVMTGAQASFDVLRWDGTCVSVMEGEITTRRPPAPKPAPIRFGHLEERTRQALLSSPKVKATHESLASKCGAATTPAEKKACDKADGAFHRAVVEYVRSGASLPTPARRP